MDSTRLDDLFGRYDQGLISRRQLVSACLALAASTWAAAQSGAPLATTGRTISHVQLVVGDLKRSEEFYGKLVGAKFLKAYGENIHTLALPGEKGWISLRQAKENVGQMEHYAIGVEDFKSERLVASIARSLPSTKVDANPRSVFVSDPDGFKVQLISKDDNGG